MSARFKTGDRVRCTLGENVLVGTVTGYGLHVEDFDWITGLPLYEKHWKVEVLPPREREWQNGDVVRDPKGVLFVRDDGCWKVANKGSWYADDAMERPLTLLVPAEDGAA